MSAQSDHHTIGCMEIWGGNSLTNKSLDIPGFDIWVGSIPHAGQAHGGDIYYLSSCGAGDVARFSLADVSGHGKGASHLARRLRRLMRRHINTLDQRKFANSLNKEFSKLADRGMYATALLTAYHTQTDHMIICNAGHPRPLFYRAITGIWRLLDHEMDDCLDNIMNLPLGILTPTDYQQFGLKLQPGDILVMYTDAVLEVFDKSGSRLGESGLLTLLTTLPTNSAASLGEAMLSRLQSSGVANDDLTLMVLSHNATNPSPPSWWERLQGMVRMLDLR